MKHSFWTRSATAAAIAATLVFPFASSAQAQRDEHGRPRVERDYHRDEHHGPGGGAVVGGVLLGLGAAALAGGIIAAQRPYAPPPAVYYAPPPPAYYAPPPPVYGY